MNHPRDPDKAHQVTIPQGGVLTWIIDPRGQTTTFNHFVDPISGLDSVEIQTINSVGSPAANESVVLSYLPYTPSSDGYLSIVYDNPDGLGPRAAREERLIYDTQGRLVQVSVGAVGALSQTTTFSYTTLEADARLASIAYPDGASVAIDLTREANRLVIPSEVTGPILTNDRRALQIGSPSSPNPIPDYAVITQKRSANSDPQRTVVQLDHRGRLLQHWDPQQVHALGLTAITSWGDAEFQLLRNHIDLSTEYTRQATQWDSFGQITGNDWGELLEIASPDPDKILVGGVLQSNGPASRQVASYTYSNNNPVAAQFPEQTDGAWTWNDTFDIVTLAIDDTGNRFIQDVDAGTGLVTRQRWEHPGPVWQNDITPTDVNGDGVTEPLDALLIINYLSANGAGPPPPGAQHAPPFYDVNGDGEIAPLDALLITNYLANPNSSNIIPTKQVLREVHTTYVDNPTLPKGLIDQQTIVTGRASGDTVISYTYFNTPGDLARHARIASITEVSSDGDAVTYFDYDNRGNLSQITDPVGRVTKHFYDQRDRLVATLSPDPDGPGGALLPVLTRYDYL